MSRFILAIDQGTTGSTALIFNRDGEIVSRAYTELTQHYPRPGWVEHDALEIWRTTAQVVGEAMVAGHVQSRDIAAIGITNQRETTVMWDKNSGAPIHNAIVWQCRRTSDY
ncbi:glycerol kinase, partial [candidate division KSB1 bacterium]|nr:glycerol kinase [candidate division KSB1 bacterium]